MDSLSPEELELINAHGPYNHAVWSGKGVNVSNEEALGGRGSFLVDKIGECIRTNFTGNNFESLSIVDVGCYDGWMLHQLSRFKFHRMLGIEPRKKNIIKGRKIREILNIQTPVEFRVGDLSILGSEKFDIVICTGVLHHVESVTAAIRSLSAICKRMLFIETVCLPSKFITHP